MKKPIHILMLEDDEADAALEQRTMRDGGIGFSIVRVQSEPDFVQELDGNPPDVILSDYSMPGFDGHIALGIAQKKRPDIPFIFVTGTMGEEVAIETLKNGATDYVLKTRLARLVPAVHRALREAQERNDRRLAEVQLRESHQQLRALSVYLQHVREEERTRIAREVHDELGQALTGCKLDVSWIAHRLSRNQKELLQKAESLSANIDSTIQTVRRISTELRPGILDYLGLAAALEWQAQEFQSRTGIRCHVTTQLRGPPLDPELTTTFFRIFQETLTNVIRHAEATDVDVELKEEAARIILEVKDNGRGISRDEISNPRSMGLLGMRERAALLGGNFRIQRLRDGKGTSACVAIPRRPRNRRAKVNNPLNHEHSSGRRPRRRPAWVETNSH
ncbi:MAG TPA: histidine kinase [Verrucomicrobiae bacterium]|jgi:signal transduction histidine kinase|nr:histidine kinase [Verrucomicrobiae bacterium]